MKKQLLYLFLSLLIIAGAAGVFYLYKQQPDKVSVANETEQVDGEQNNVDETIITSAPTQFINSGPAPELVGLTNWLNLSEEVKQLTLAELKGKVVLLNFWTYSCIDCTRATPFITKWRNTYKDQGLVVIGVHTPQYMFEKVTENVKGAVKGQALPYPIAQDNDYKTWTAYKNQFWPATYLIDKNGNIVYTQYGGGKYGQTEKAIRTLLGLEGEFIIPEPPAAVNPNQTPDTYAGLTKIGGSFGGAEKTLTNEQIYIFPKKLSKNKFALEGSWKFNQESVVHTRGYGRMILNFNASSLTMVAQSPEPVAVKVYVDDLLVKGVVIKDMNEYQLFDSLTAGNHTLRLEIPDNTLQIFNFIFK